MKWASTLGTGIREGVEPWGRPVFEPGVGWDGGWLGPAWLARWKKAEVWTELRGSHWGTEHKRPWLPEEGEALCTFLH